MLSFDIPPVNQEDISQPFEDQFLMCNALEAQLANAALVRGRHSAFEPRESVLAGVGGK